MKALIKITTKLLLLVLFVSLYNCEKEINDDLEEFKTQQDLNIESYRFYGDSIYNINKSLKKHISKNFTKERTKTNNNSRLNSNIYGFSIDTSRVQLLATDYYNSFSFVIERENYNETILENYVYTIYNDSTHNQLLVTYPKNLINGEYIIDIDYATAQYIDDSSLIVASQTDPCPNTELPIAVWDPDINCEYFNCTAGGNHEYGQQCDGSSSQQPKKVCAGGYVPGCTGSGISDTGDDNGSGNNTGGGSDPPNDPLPDDDNQIPVIPFTPDYITPILNCINGTSGIGQTITASIITAQQLELLTDVQLMQIDKYLRNSSCSEEAQQEVVDEITELLCVVNLSSTLELVLTELNNLVVSNEIQSFLSENNYSCDSYSSAVSFVQSNLDDLEFEDYDIGPSCESFNFETTTSDAFWQNAAVKNIRFRVVVLSSQGSYVNFDIRFPQPILFGVPTNMVNGGNISNGLAAELSAQALSITMSEVVNTYGNQLVSELQVRLYFKERLKYNYPIITNGGRATFNPMVLPVVPTEYETNFFGTGNCD